MYVGNVLLKFALGPPKIQPNVRSMDESQYAENHSRPGSLTSVGLNSRSTSLKYKSPAVSGDLSVVSVWRILFMMVISILIDIFLIC